MSVAVVKTTACIPWAKSMPSRARVLECTVERVFNDGFLTMNATIVLQSDTYHIDLSLKAPTENLTAFEVLIVGAREMLFLVKYYDDINACLTKFIAANAVEQL